MTQILPIELIERILSHIGPYGDYTAVLTLLRCRRICKAFDVLVRDSVEIWDKHYTWLHHCHQTRSDCDPSPPGRIQYICCRTMRDRQALDILEQLLVQATGRQEQMRKLGALGMDVYDCLHAVHRRRSEGNTWLDNSDQYCLARQYWLYEMFTFLLRRHALRKLREIETLPFTEGFLLLGCLRGDDYQQVRS